MLDKEIRLRCLPMNHWSVVWAALRHDECKLIEKSYLIAWQTKSWLFKVASAEFGMGLLGTQHICIATDALSGSSCTSLN